MEGGQGSHEGSLSAGVRPRCYVLDQCGRQMIVSAKLASVKAFPLRAADLNRRRERAGRRNQHGLTGTEEFLAQMRGGMSAVWLRKRLGTFSRRVAPASPTRSQLRTTPRRWPGAICPVRWTADRPGLEAPSRGPAEATCASPQAPMDRNGPHEARHEVSFLGGRRHLPIVSLRRAA